MSVFDGWRHRWRMWRNRDAYEAEMDEEARFHASLAGTQRRLGNLTQLKEARRHEAGLDRLDGIALDVRHLFRTLRRAPGFAAATTLILALGIGFTTAAVSIVDHVLLRALPFREPERFMMMLERDQHGGFRTPSAPTVADWQRDPDVSRAFEGVSFVRGDGMTVRIGSDSEDAGTAFVAPDFFALFGVRPELGRVLDGADHAPDAAPVAVMSHKLWMRRFGGDRALVGRSIDVEGVPTTVVGILPPGAVYPGFADLWTPITHYTKKEILLRRGFHADSRTVGRLRDGVDSTQAAVMMRTVGARLATEYPAEQAGWMPSMIPVRTEIIGNVGPMLWTLAGAATVVLLLACANVASLLLARIAMRTRELAMRSALGASRMRLARQLLTESAVLAVFGGALGTAVAAAGVRIAVGVLGDRLPRVDELGLDYRVLLVAIGATLATTLLCGLWPTIRATRERSADALRASPLATIGHRRESRGRRVLVTAQFALALALLVGAGLLAQSFMRVAAVDVGFDPAGLVTLRIVPPTAKYGKPEEAAVLYRRLMEATRAIPGVSETAFINHMPYGTASIFTSVSIEGRSSLDSSNQVFYRTVSASYLTTMRMRMAAGRWFDDADIQSPGGGFVVNEAMAKAYWPGASAIGQRLTVTRASQGRKDFGQPLHGTVIGVVANVHQQRQDVTPAAEVYVPFTLETWPWGMLMMRARDGRGSIPSLLRAIESVDPGVIPPGVTGAAAFGVVEESIAGSLKPRRLSMAVLAAFSACALLLAAIGMYGVVAYSVAQRTQEIGVRKALGATSVSIVGLMFRESLLVVAIGIVAGGGAAFLGARLIRSMLYGTEFTDPAAYAVAIGLMAGVACVATYLPSRRALRLDPVIAMRGD